MSSPLSGSSTSVRTITGRTPNCASSSGDARCAVGPSYATSGPKYAVAAWHSPSLPSRSVTPGRQPCWWTVPIGLTTTPSPVPSSRSESAGLRYEPSPSPMTIVNVESSTQLPEYCAPIGTEKLNMASTRSFGTSSSTANGPPTETPPRSVARSKVNVSVSPKPTDMSPKSGSAPETLWRPGGSARPTLPVSSGDGLAVWLRTPEVDARLRMLSPGSRSAVQLRWPLTRPSPKNSGPCRHDGSVIVTVNVESSVHAPL